MTSLERIAGLVAACSMGWLVAHRRSEVVQQWREAEDEPLWSGPIAYRRVRGSGPERTDAPDVLLILHGLGASSDYFGQWPTEMGADVEVIIPDLLGFGRSAKDGADFTLASHGAHLQRFIADVVPDDARLVIASHSMGAALALWLGVEMGHCIDRVVLVGPPVFPSPEEAIDGAASLSPLFRLAVTDNPVARWLVGLNEGHQEVMGVVLSAMSPNMPHGLARWASRNTWPSLSGSIDSMILDVDWRTLFDSDVPTTIVRGSSDHLGIDDAIDDLVGSNDHVDMEIVDGAGHHVFITHGARIAASMTVADAETSSA